MALTDVKALIFDVFGTVVDWRSSIIAHGREFGRVQGVEADWAVFADAWRDQQAEHHQQALHRKEEQCEDAGLFRVGSQQPFDEADGRQQSNRAAEQRGDGHDEFPGGRCDHGS